MKDLLRSRRPRRRAFWLRREWEGLTASIVVAVLVTAVGLAVNFPDRIAGFFRPHASQPAVIFLVNFLVVWLVALLVLAYRRWRRATLRSQELEDIVDSINPDVLLVVDAQRTILMANVSTYRMFGYQLEEVLNQKTDLLYSDRRTIPGERHEVYDALEREGFHIGLATGRKKDGRTFPLEIISGLLKRHGGSVLLLRDITERKKSEERLLEREAQLRQAQKMEALGLLAGGVAHDFNNLLTSILGFGHLALDALPAEHDVRADLEEVIRAGERAAKLTAQLLAMGRKQPLQIRPLPLNSAVQGMAEMLRRTLGEDVDMKLDLDQSLGYVTGDPGGVEQVILNLAVNARDAMPRGGRLVIATSRVVIEEEGGRPLVGVEPGAYGLLKVRDSGCGMTAETRNHIFEPFFTTKDVGKGTGLGLSTVYGIVRQCGGFVEVDSEPGQGAEFRVFFREAQPPETEAGAPREAAMLRGTETILVVEDDPGVRGFAVRVLKNLGYTVLEASGSRQALALLAHRRERVHLIVTDIVLPEASGYEWVDQARRTRDDFRVLFVTGFDREAAAQRAGASRTRDPVLLKPYSQTALASSVRQALDSPP